MFENQLSRGALILLLMLSATTLNARAQQETEPDALPDTPAEAAEAGAAGGIFEHLKIELSDIEELAERASDVLAGETVRMTLDDAVQAALMANQDILIVSFEPRIAASDLMAERGVFDPVLRGFASESDSDQPASPQAIVFGGITSIDEELRDFGVGLGGLTPHGTTYDVSYGTTRTLGTFTGDESEYAVGLTLTVTQPLLRGVGKTAQLAQVRVARNTLGISAYDVARLTEVTLGEVIKAYWDLVGAIENLRVRRESLANANRLVEINEQRLEIGTAAAIEVLQAKSSAASRISDVIAARTDVDNAEDVLKQLVGMQDGELFSSKHIIPVERPQAHPTDWNVERSMAVALENRAEIRTAELQIESSEVLRKQARNLKWPQLDIEGSYTANDRSFEFDDAESGARHREGEIWTIGLVGSIPLGNRTARGNFRAASLRLEQNEQRLLKQQQDVMLEVRVAMRDALSSEVLVESTRQTRILEEANVAAEDRRLQLGVTTSQDLLDRQEDLTEAQVREVQAMINFEKALVDLRVAEGILLRELGIEMDLPE